METFYHNSEDIATKLLNLRQTSKFLQGRINKFCIDIFYRHMDQDKVRKIETVLVRLPTIGTLDGIKLVSTRHASHKREDDTGDSRSTNQRPSRLCDACSVLTSFVTSHVPTKDASCNRCCLLNRCLDNCICLRSRFLATIAILP